jgi:AcrR family transcriptional regulator
MVTSVPKPAAPRDADAMRERILSAIGAMILRDGLGGIGVNALAREAGCDKVLIYRYFGDLQGAYAAFAARSDFWWTLGELTRGVDPLRLSLADAMKQILRRHAGAIRSRPVTLAVMAAEPMQRTALVVALEEVRERRSIELARWMAEHFPQPAGVDLEAIGMILGVAVNYLAVRAQKIRVMSGVPIQSDQDWARIGAALDALVDGVLPAP